MTERIDSSSLLHSWPYLRDWDDGRRDVPPKPTWCELMELLNPFETSVDLGFYAITDWDSSDMREVRLSLGSPALWEHHTPHHSRLLSPLIQGFARREVFGFSVALSRGALPYIHDERRAAFSTLLALPPTPEPPEPPTRLLGGTYLWLLLALSSIEPCYFPGVEELCKREEVWRGFYQRQQQTFSDKGFEHRVSSEQILSTWKWDIASRGPREVVVPKLPERL